MKKSNEMDLKILKEGSPIVQEKIYQLISLSFHGIICCGIKTNFGPYLNCGFYMQFYYLPIICISLNVSILISNKLSFLLQFLTLSFNLTFTHS